MKQHKSSPERGEHKGGNSANFLYVLFGFASVLVVLQAFGIFKTFDRQHTATILDVKNAAYENRPAPEFRAARGSENVDAVLSSIKTEYESPVFTDIQKANESNNWGLTDDEAKFYDDMRRRYGATKDNWLGVVQRANATYRAVQSIFGTSDVASLLKDGRAAADAFARIQQTFGISTLDCLNFYQAGRANTLRDWANFVESRRS